MYIINATHYLNANGAISQEHGPARKMAEFFGNIIIDATDPHLKTEKQKCIQCKCQGTIKASMTASDEIQWQCVACKEEGIISKWQNTLWDMALKKDSSQNH